MATSKAGGGTGGRSRTGAGASGGAGGAESTGAQGGTGRGRASTASAPTAGSVVPPVETTVSSAVAETEGATAPRTRARKATNASIAGIDTGAAGGVTPGSAAASTGEGRTPVGTTRRTVGGTGTAGAAKTTGAAKTVGTPAQSAGTAAKSASGARKGPSAKTVVAAGAAGAAVAAGATVAASAGLNLLRELRDWASERVSGWNHQDWTGLLDTLRGRGHDVENPDAIGMSLERERLAVVLSRVEGLGAKRADAVVNHYGTLWSLRQASPEEIAASTKLPPALAQKVAQSVL